MTQPATQPHSLKSHTARRSVGLGRRSYDLARVAAVVAMVLLPLSPVSAQPNNNQDDPNKIEAPQPRPPSKPASTIAGMMSAMLLGAMVIGVNFIPSKRGHQD